MRKLGIGVPIWVAERVPSRMALLKPGMTEPQVLATLGLIGYHTSQFASGGWNHTHMSYELRPEMILAMEFDYTTMPPQLLSADVVGTDEADRWKGALALLSICIGLALIRSRLARVS